MFGLTSSSGWGRGERAHSLSDEHLQQCLWEIDDACEEKNISSRFSIVFDGASGTACHV